MTKKQMAIKITQQLFYDPENGIGEDHWKVKDLMHSTAKNLKALYKLALKAEAAYKLLDEADDNLF